LDRILDLAARCCGYVAGAFALAMMLLTVVDVLARSLFNRPIHGVYDLVELALACTIFFALPAVFLRDGHIVVDLVDHMAPRAARWLRHVAAAITVALLAVMCRQMIEPVQDTLAFGDVTADLSLPRILYWAPVLAGVALSAVGAVAMLVREMRR
jgi:TRAP-type C4-dicarboxylate transport system permease small subunit